MGTVLGLGPIGWLAALVGGFVVGGVFFMSIKAQVDYVVQNRGPEWLVPAAMFGRMLFVAAVLAMLLLWVPRPALAGVVLGGTIGAVVARVLIGRMVKGRTDGTDSPQRHEGTENGDDR